jgi:hypothetical protein
VSTLRDLLRRLVLADVRFIVVGGVAVVLHGHLRATKDLDLVLDLAPDQTRKALQVMLDAGLRPTVPVNALDFADAAIRHSWIEEKNMLVFQMRDPNDARRNVDLFVEPPMDFEEMWARSVRLPIGDVTIPVAAIGDLIEMKRRSGRPQDLDDIAQLEKLEKLDE